MYVRRPTGACKRADRCRCAQKEDVRHCALAQCRSLHTLQHSLTLPYVAAFFHYRKRSPFFFLLIVTRARSVQLWMIETKAYRWEGRQSTKRTAAHGDSFYFFSDCVSWVALTSFVNDNITYVTHAKGLIAAGPDVTLDRVSIEYVCGDCNRVRNLPCL
jgi:hypothetical protein